MKTPRRPILRVDVDYAIDNTVWNLGNDVLYDLCRNHPKHRRVEVVAAKVWLIGRSYATGLERLKRGSSEKGEHFILKEIVPCLRESGLDRRLSKFPQRSDG